MQIPKGFKLVQDSPVDWGSPKTVEQLIRQLLTMDPQTIVKSAHRLELRKGEIKYAHQHLSLSYEVIGQRWLEGGREAGEGQQKVLMFWTKHDDREPVDIELPTYNHEAMGCGIEDRGITDRYEACQYGFDQAMEMVASLLESFGPLFAEPDQEELNRLRILVDSHEHVVAHLEKQISILEIGRK